MESFHFHAKQMPKTKIEETHMKTLCLVFHFKSQSSEGKWPCYPQVVFSEHFCFVYLFTFGCSGFSLLCADLLQLRWMEATLCCTVRASRCSGLSCCRAQAPGCTRFSSCGTWAQELWHTGLVALHYVESSQPRGQTYVLCVGRWVLYHWVIWEALVSVLFNIFFY